MFYFLFQSTPIHADVPRPESAHFVTASSPASPALESTLGSVRAAATLRPVGVGQGQLLQRVLTFQDNGRLPSLDREVQYHFDPEVVQGAGSLNPPAFTYPIYEDTPKTTRARKSRKKGQAPSRFSLRRGRKYEE